MCHRKLTEEKDLWARTAMGQWYECGMNYRSFSRDPRRCIRPAMCTDANQRRMEVRDETFVHETIQTAVSWISEWQRKLLPGLSWCDISCLRRLSVAKLHFIFAFGLYISRGLIVGLEKTLQMFTSFTHCHSRKLWAIFLCWADIAGVIHPEKHRSGCYSWQWTWSGISHSLTFMHHASYI